MSRYLILIILNTPLILIAITNAIVSFKMKHISLRRLVYKITFWVTVLLGLIFTQTAYIFLYKEGLTKTEPLSLFDVIQITGIIYIFFLVNRLYVKVDILERRAQDLHQEISIKLSDTNKTKFL